MDPSSWWWLWHHPSEHGPRVHPRSAVVSSSVLRYRVHFHPTLRGLGKIPRWPDRPSFSHASSKMTLRSFSCIPLRCHHPTPSPTLSTPTHGPRQLLNLRPLLRGLRWAPDPPAHKSLWWPDNESTISHRCSSSLARPHPQLACPHGWWRQGSRSRLLLVQGIRCPSPMCSTEVETFPL